MAIPNPNPNIADGIKSDNKTYSSNKIESLIKTATELPIPEAGDAGKVLKVNAAGDGYELGNAGGSSYIKTVLFEGNALSQSITLNESYKNYDALIFEVVFKYDPSMQESSHMCSPYISTDFDIGSPYRMDIGYVAPDDIRVMLYFTISSNTSLNWLSEDIVLSKVIGIKF